MRIDNGVVYRFDNEINIFAKKFGLTAEIDHTLYNKKTDVRLSDGIKYKRYVLEWDEVPNFAAAVNTVVNDASKFFVPYSGYRAYKNPSISPFEIKDVIFNNPATIVLWADGTKTVVKCQEDDIYDEEVGLALCFAKKALGNKSNFNNIFKKWVPEVQSDYVYQGTVELSQEIRLSAADALEKLAGELRRPISPDQV